MRTADCCALYCLLMVLGRLPWMSLRCCCAARSPPARPATGPNLRTHELLLLKEMLQLIENYTFVMDLQFDGELQTSISSDFSSALENYLRTTRREERDHSIVHRALLGAFRLRGNAVKDRLASGKLLTIRRAQFDSTAKWWLDLLEMIVQSGGFDVNSIDAEGITRMSPLELAIKLRMTGAVLVLLDHGARLCVSSASLDCSDALQYAVVNQDLKIISLLVETFRRERLLTKRSLPVSDETCNDFCLFLTRKGRSGSFSSLEIAYNHCQFGLSCTALQFLLSHTSNCSFTEDQGPWWSSKIDSSKQKNSLQICPESSFSKRSPHLRNASVVFGGWLPEWAAVTGAAQTRGWAAYGDWRLGREGCDLPRFNIGQLSAEKFQKFIVDLSIPVVIEGAMTGWALFEEWERQRLLEEYGSVDVLVGSIPYGEVFGERFGYASLQEFLSYMERYARDPAPGVGGAEKTVKSSEGEEGREGEGKVFSPPLYVFDSHVLEQNFSQCYSMPAIFSIWSPATHHNQFILGPAGSGAPFHFHCHAANALVYGRKKWFLLPPGKAVYSKQHPLLWYRQQYGRVDEELLECLQRSGELLYIPSGWSHSTVNLDECIGLAVEFESREC